MKRVVLSVKWRLTPANRGLTPAHGVNCPGACSGRRLPHSFEKFFQDQCVIEYFVLRSKKQCQAFLLVSKFIEPAETLFALGFRKFFQILSAKGLPLFRASVIPAAQFVGGGKITQPFLDRSFFFREPTRPKAIHEYTRPVGACCRLIHPLDCNVHSQQKFFTL